MKWMSVTLMDHQSAKVSHNFTFSVTYSLRDKTLSQSDIKIRAKWWVTVRLMKWFRHGMELLSVIKWRAVVGATAFVLTESCELLSWLYEYFKSKQLMYFQLFC